MSSHVAVVGGGHNGLVAANYLARMGSHVTLVEARAELGGVVGRTKYMPGYSASITNSPGSFEGRIIEDLELERYGLRFHFPEVTLVHPMVDRVFVGWRDRDLVAAQLEAGAAGDAARHRALISRLDALGAATRLSLWSQPSSLEEVLAAMDPEVRAEFSEVMLRGSLMDLLDQSLKGDDAKALMMMVALNGQLISPHAPGSAIGLLMRPISRASSPQDVLGIRDAPLRGSVGLPIGSMSAIVDALTRSAEANGVEIRRNSTVERIELGDDGRVRGVVLENGGCIENIDAAVVTLEPSLMRGLLPDADLPDSAWPTRPSGSAFKIAFALDGLPHLAGAPDGIPVEKLLEAQFRIGPTPQYISSAVHDGVAGRPSDAPIIWGLIPSLTSPGIAPPGMHLMSLNVWHAPHSLGADYWQQHGDEFVLRCLAQLEPRLPGLTDRIVDTKWFSPHDLETEFRLTGSNITHGDMIPPQFLDGRPRAAFTEALHRMGIALGGAGTWPGGYVTGIPGRNAAALTHRMLNREIERAR